MSDLATGALDNLAGSGICCAAYGPGRQASPYFGCGWVSSSTTCWPFASPHYQEHVMFVNKDQIKGRAKEAKGKIKEVTGDLVGNQKLKTEGKIEKNLGKAQAKVGDVKQDLKH
jgi:uncharacterized protein YjbJ (UPF0337 family)